MPSHSFISFSFFTLPTSLTSPPFYLFHWQTLKFSCWLKTLVIDVRTRGKGGEMSFSGLWTCLSLSKRFWGTLFNVLGCSHLSGFGVMDLTCFNVTVVLFSHDSLVYLDETVTETWNLLHCVNILVVKSLIFNKTIRKLFPDISENPILCVAITSF